MQTIDKRLTPELQERLNKYSPVNPKMEFKYVPEGFRIEAPKNLWPVFNLKGLSSSDSMTGDFYDDKSGKMSIHMGKYYLHYFKYGVKGWSNWVIDFKPEYISPFGCLTDEAIALFSEQMIIEFANAIISGTELTQDELEGL